MDKLCRKLELKDLVPCQMQRLTKYPLLIENLMKYTQSKSVYLLLIENLMKYTQSKSDCVSSADREPHEIHTE